jgi:hypothetical protein
MSCHGRRLFDDQVTLLALNLVEAIVDGVSLQRCGG